MTKKERNKVIDTEDASRGPLSGCIRLADSSRVIQRLKVSHRVFLSRLARPLLTCLSRSHSVTLRATAFIK